MTALAVEDPHALLRARVFESLEKQGFTITETGKIAMPDRADKTSLRALHDEAVQTNRAKARAALARREPDLMASLADPGEIDPARIAPSLREVTSKSSRDAFLWRWTSLHWSIPTSGGYGRRLRFLVWDDQHDRLIGLIGLHDPVISLGSRDRWIGWNKTAREERLTSVMDAFVLGAVPPYAGLLGGKLVALLAASTEVRDAFRRKYGQATTRISGRVLDTNLALITTTSALDRSSIYNRLKRPDGTLGMLSAGFTNGTGDFHLSGDLYEDLAALAKEHASPSARSRKWDPDRPGLAFRNRREVIQKAFGVLGIPDGVRKHGIRREVFLAPLAANTPAVLADGAEPDWTGLLSSEEIGTWWRERYAVSRSERMPAWREFDPQTWRLWPDSTSMLTLMREENRR